jgi:hypothetical protein
MVASHHVAKEALKKGRRSREVKGGGRGFDTDGCPLPVMPICGRRYSNLGRGGGGVLCQFQERKGIGHLGWRSTPDVQLPWNAKGNNEWL